MNPNTSIAFTYITGLILLVSSFVFGQIQIGLAVLGVLFIALGGLSETSLGVVKLLDTRIMALIWTVLAILTAFAPNLFGITSNQNLLWGSIGLGLTNLVLILVSKFKLDETK